MANYLNFTKAVFNPYNPKVLNEGQFSWMTYDTDKQIGSESQNTIDVYMYDDKGNQWYEKRYEGYGEFGGMDYYELLATMNGYSEDDLIKKYKGKDMRDIGIDLAFKKLKTKAKGNKVLFPALVEDPRFNWKRHDFTQEAESDPNQSWYQEPEYDDYEDDDYYESIKTNEGVMSNIHLLADASKDFEDFKKKFKKDYKKVFQNTPDFMDWLYNMYKDMAPLKAGEEVEEELTWDSLKESLGLNEGRSITKISQEHAATIVEMSNTVKEWKKADGDRKAELLEKLRALNAQKADLEKELDDAVAGKDRNIQLALEEAEELAYLEIDIKNILEVNGQEK